MSQGLQEHSGHGEGEDDDRPMAWPVTPCSVKHPGVTLGNEITTPFSTTVALDASGASPVVVQNGDFGWVIGPSARGRLEFFAVILVGTSWDLLAQISVNADEAPDRATGFSIGPALQHTAQVTPFGSENGPIRHVRHYEEAGARRDWNATSQAWSDRHPTLHVAVDSRGTLSVAYGQDALLSAGLAFITGSSNALEFPEPFRNATAIQSGRLALVMTRSQQDGRGTPTSVCLLTQEARQQDSLGPDTGQWAIVSQISLNGLSGNPLRADLNEESDHADFASRPGHAADPPAHQPHRVDAGMSTVEPSDGSGDSEGRVSSHRLDQKLSSTLHSLAHRVRGASVSLATIAALASMIIYAASRLVNLSGFPIYFHGDEAYQIVAGQRLIASGFRNELNVLFPLYFSNGGSWAPLLPVYFHIVSTSLFGTSVEIARGTSAVFSIFGVLAATLLARDGIHARTWWAVPLWFTIVPSWFLHSRTTFETVYAVSGFAVFCFCYVKYRAGHMGAGYGAILAAAFTFYTYTNGQLIIGLAGLLLVVSDLPYHWTQRRHLLPFLATGVVCLVPYIMFQRAAPDATADQLWRVSSYLVLDIPLAEKVRQFAFHYWGGLSPTYWFRPTQLDLGRHLMLGYTHLPQLFAPFILIGILVSLSRIRIAVYRIILIALITAPIGASLTDVGITRVLAVVVPATLLAVVGLEWLIAIPLPDRSAGRLGFLRTLDQWVQGMTAPGSIAGTTRPGWHAIALFGVGAILSTNIVADSFLNGPTWLTDYGLYGQQWGAVQVFREVVTRARKSPDDKFFISSTWANGTDLYLPFFVPSLQAEGRVLMANVRDFLGGRRPLDEHMVFVMTADEVQLARASRRFGQILIDSTMHYPDGSDAFSFVRLGYSADFDRIVSEERAARVALRNGQVVVKGQRLEVRHTIIDAGTLGDIFDGDSRTLGRFNGGNPAILEFAYPQPKDMSHLTIVLSAGNWDLVVKTYADTGTETIYRKTVESRVDPTIEFDLTPGKVSAVHLEILQRGAGQESIVHLRDVIIS